MKECLREEVLQSYLDGELRQQSMEQVTSHLASCMTCSDLARELEQENSVLAAALAPEFEAAVPSEHLRQRIEAAIAATQIEPVGGDARATSVRNWLSSISDLFTFRPQRAFAYASLLLIVGFGLIMAMMRWQTTPTTPSNPEVAVNTPLTNPPAPSTSPTNNPVNSPEINNTLASVPKPRQARNNPRSQTAARGAEVASANHVKLLPGERSYLQTIAQLDSTIKAEKSTMKPGVQAEYQRNLAFVDRTLAVARTAAKSNPNDPDAAEFMFSAYQSKVDLLNTVAEARVINK